jgi:DNA-binding transcriptional MocR family regulator
MKSPRPLMPAEVERIARGYANGKSVREMAEALGRGRSSIENVVARLVREGRLKRRRKPRKGPDEAARPPAPRREESPRKCLGCARVFRSPEPVAVNRLCLNCTKRAQVMA